MAEFGINKHVLNRTHWVELHKVSGHIDHRHTWDLSIVIHKTYGRDGSAIKCQNKKGTLIVTREYVIVHILAVFSSNNNSDICKCLSRILHQLSNWLVHGVGFDLGDGL